MENYLNGFINSLSEDAFKYVLNKMTEINIYRNKIDQESIEDRERQLKNKKEIDILYQKIEPLGSCERSILLNKYKKHIEKIQNKSDLKIIFNKKTSISELKEILKKYVPATHLETNAYVLMEAKLAGKSI